VTNEHYLYVSYFAAAAAGVAGALIVTLVLRRPHREATAGDGALGTLLRRAFPAWLVLGVLLAFTSVSYFDCAHGKYAQIVADRDYLVAKSQEQTVAMARGMAVGLLAYGFVLVPFLWARARTARGADDKEHPHPTLSPPTRRGKTGG
jgi:hypothetical protein